MAGEFFKLIADVVEAVAGDDVKRAMGAYADGRATQTAPDDTPVAYVYERRLTRPRDPGVNDR
jgi:hypothetical protein